jgi:hypothetical protein
VAQTAPSATQHLAPVRLEGLDPTRRFRVVDETPPGDQHAADIDPRQVSTELSGRLLEEVGIRLGVVAPETARVLHARALD